MIKEIIQMYKKDLNFKVIVTQVYIMIKINWIELDLQFDRMMRSQVGGS